MCKFDTDNTSILVVHAAMHSDNRQDAGWSAQLPFSPDFAAQCKIQTRTHAHTPVQEPNKMQSNEEGSNRMRATLTMF